MTITDNRRFLIKATVAHMVTYFVCGVIFSLALNYEGVWQSGMFGSGETAMRDYNSWWIAAGPLLQVFRGMLFGGILLLIPREFFKHKYAWLKLWAIVAGIGIINTPGPGSGSIEGIIYTTASWQVHTIYCVEIYLQTLWFSWWVCREKKEKPQSLPTKLKLPIISAAITVLATSIFGVLIAFINGVDPMTGAQDAGAMITLLLMALMMFLAALWYLQKPGKRRIIAFIAACYLINALPTMIYNIIMDSAFRSPLSLLTAIVPTFVTWLIMRSKAGHAS